MYSLACLIDTTPTCLDGANRRYKFEVIKEHGDERIGHIVSVLNRSICLGVYDGTGPYVATWPCKPSGNDTAQLWTYNVATRHLTVFGYCLSPQNDGALLDVWAGPQSDGSTVAVLFNRGTKPHDVTAKFSDLGVGSKCVIRDLWERKDVGTFDNSYTVNLRSHQSVMIRLTCM